MTHKFRFGVITIQNAPWEELNRRWRFIEKAGFDSIWVADHFVHWAKTLMPFFESWTTLSGIACQTSKIRVGTLVTNMFWRHPAWLARQALTLDHLSNGRLDIGLGAGGSADVEHLMVGIQKLSAGEKVARFSEYVDVIDQLLRNPVTSYYGKYYQLQEASMQPDPIQKPRPPIVIGARGKMMLKLVAKYADTWNTLGSHESFDEQCEAIQKQSKILDAHCHEIGRNPESIRRSYVIYETRAISTMGKMKVYENVEDFVNVVERCHELGMDEVILGYPFVDEQKEAFEQIALEIVPELRKRHL